MRHVLSFSASLFTADPLSHVHTSPLLSVNLGGPVSILVPRARGRAFHAQLKSDNTGSPGGPMSYVCLPQAC